MAAVDGMEARSLSFESALQSLAALVHRIALMQLAPSALTDEFEAARLAPFAAAFDPEFLQLAYQIAIHGRDELSLAPDETTGFSMTLLRLFAFRPQQPAALGGVLAGGGGQGQARALPELPRAAATAPCPAALAPSAVEVRSATPPPVVAAPRVIAPAPAKVEMPPLAPEPAKAVESATAPDFGCSVPPWEDLPPEADEIAPAGHAQSEPLPAVTSQAVRHAEPVAARKAATEPAALVAAPSSPITALSASPDWHGLLGELGLSGFSRELAQHCELVGTEGDVFKLRLSHAHRHLLQINRTGPEKLQEALSAHFGRPLRVVGMPVALATLRFSQPNGETWIEMPGASFTMLPPSAGALASPANHGARHHRKSLHSIWYWPFCHRLSWAHSLFSGLKSISLIR